MPADNPERAGWWNCKHLGHGAGVMAYLGCYLYHGVIQERDIVGCDGHHGHLPLA